MNFEEAAEYVVAGGVGIIPTDTVYGIIGSAFSSNAVERIYEIKQRDRYKPLIVMISSIDQLEQFGVVLSTELIGVLSKYWPGKYSIMLPTIDDQFEYLHRGTDKIAFRLPSDEVLRDFISQVGPIVVPSANPQGDFPATTRDEAYRYFGTQVDFYVDGGKRDEKPSTIIDFEDGEVKIVRD